MPLGMRTGKMPAPRGKRVSHVRSEQQVRQQRMIDEAVERLRQADWEKDTAAQQRAADAAAAQAAAEQAQLDEFVSFLHCVFVRNPCI
jgi:hypothetical protein